jgi:hypothetical protein
MGEGLVRRDVQSAGFRYFGKIIGAGVAVFVIAVKDSDFRELVVRRVFDELPHRKLRVPERAKEVCIALLQPGRRCPGANQRDFRFFDDRSGRQNIAAMQRTDDRGDMVDLNKLRRRTNGLFGRRSIVVFNERKLAPEESALVIDLADRHRHAVA